MKSPAKRRGLDAAGTAALGLAGLPIQATVIDDESLPWIPFTPYSNDVAVKYFRLDPLRGESILLFKAPAGARLPRLHHSGSAIVYTVEGRWKYAEHDWIAGPGSIVFGPAAATQTAIVVGDDAAVVTLNIIVGDVVLYDEAGEVLAIENWRSALRRYHDYCKTAGVTPRELCVAA